MQPASLHGCPGQRVQRGRPGPVAALTARLRPSMSSTVIPATSELEAACSNASSATVIAVGLLEPAANRPAGGRVLPPCGALDVLPSRPVTHKFRPRDVTFLTVVGGCHRSTNQGELMFLAVASSQGAHGTAIGSLLVGIAMILVGGAQVAKPNLSYRMSRWQYKNKAALEPSHAALVAARGAGRPTGMRCEVVYGWRISDAREAGSPGHMTATAQP